MAKLKKNSKQLKMVHKNSNVYSYITVNKTKRAGITLLFCSLTFIVSSFIYANLMYEVHWAVFALPTVMLCSIVLVAPISEEWNYKPWQRFPQQVEHHYFD